MGMSGVLVAATHAPAAFGKDGHAVRGCWMLQQALGPWAGVWLRCKRTLASVPRMHAWVREGR